jgi:tetratricopeptide (TPR) repeat protein
LDKYEYKVKLAQIEKLVAKKDFVTAAKIADGIDWRKVKSVTTLNMIADVYEANDRLEDCYEILNMVYDRSPIGRRVVYHMTEVATKMHDFEEAIDLYKEFVKIAPHDLGKYILKYQIYRERGSSVADQITILEEYRSHEYDERWSYELACLYEEAGQIENCIEECDELILWFSEGEYVAKAIELKMKY